MPTQLSRDRPTASSQTRYLTLAWLCAAAMIAYVQRMMVAVPAQQIQRELALGDVAMGYVLAAFFLAYAAFQIPTGLVGDRFGTRRVLTALMIGSSLAAIVTALPVGVALFCIGRLLMGAAQAGFFPCSVNTFGRWFPPTERTLPSGLLTAFMSIGGVLATALVAWMLVRLSWRETFFLFSLPGLLWAAGFYRWFRDRPEDHQAVGAAELALIRQGADEHHAADAQPREPAPWLALLASPLLWLVCGQHFFRAAGMVFFQTWFPKYLQATRGVDLTTSGLLASLPLVAVVAGSLLGGAAADAIYSATRSRNLSRRGLALTSTLGAALCLAASYFVPGAVWAVLVASSGAFLAGLSSPVAYAITIDLGGRHVATVFSIMNMAGNVGAVLSPIAAAALAERAGRWDLAMLLFAAIYLAGAICWLPLNPNGELAGLRAAESKAS